MDLIENLKSRCRSTPGVLGLPEGNDPRIIKAAAHLIESGCVSKILFPSTKDQIAQSAQVAGVDLNPLESKMLFTRTAATKPLVTTAQWLKEGRITAAVGGATHSTADVIRAGISELGMREGVRTVSGSFIMHKPHVATYLFADCGVVISPTIYQLADIAQESVLTMRTVLPDIAPRVAFLSFSTKGSAQHDSAKKMAAACAEFQKRCPDVLSDGELQFDAAIDQEICQRKSPDSLIAGQANLFIFPDLNSGNIAYKITQRLAHYEAYGPLLQGLTKPFSDLSRGSTVEDIISTALISLVRGQTDIY